MHTFLKSLKECYTISEISTIVAEIDLYDLRREMYKSEYDLNFSTVIMYTVNRRTSPTLTYHWIVYYDTAQQAEAEGKLMTPPKEEFYNWVLHAKLEIGLKEIRN